MHHDYKKHVIVSGLSVKCSLEEKKLQVHTKKNRCFTEPPKKVSEMSKSVQRRRKS